MCRPERRRRSAKYSGAAVVKIIAMPDVKQRLAAVGFVPIGDTPAEFAAYLKAESEKWGKVIRDGKITLQ